MKILSKLIIVASIFISGHVTAASIGWGSSPSPIYVGDTFSVDITGSGFTSTVDGGGVNFSYDNSIFNVTSVTIGSVWDPLISSQGATNNGAGTVDGLYVNTFGAVDGNADVTGNFVVATVEFLAVGLGTSALDLSEYGLNPWASGGVLINPDFLNGQMTVVADPSGVVPVPAAAWLFGSGLLGLAGMARRKKAA